MDLLDDGDGWVANGDQCDGSVVVSMTDPWCRQGKNNWYVARREQSHHTLDGTIRAAPVLRVVEEGGCRGWLVFDATDRRVTGAKNNPGDEEGTGRRIVEGDLANSTERTPKNKMGEFRCARGKEQPCARGLLATARSRRGINEQEQNKREVGKFS